MSQEKISEKKIAELRAEIRRWPTAPWGPKVYEDGVVEWETPAGDHESFGFGNDYDQILAMYIAEMHEVLPDALDDIELHRAEIQKLRFKVDALQEAFDAALRDCAAWKKRAEQHGCDVVDGDPECG